MLSTKNHLTAHVERREVRQVSRQEIGGILTEAKRKNSNPWCLARPVHLIRREVLNIKVSFVGTFSSECQKHSIPNSLLSFVGI